MGVLYLVILSLNIYAQVVYEPINSSIYNYLDKLSHKGLIEYNDLIKPLPREYLFNKLSEVEKKRNKLTSLEKEELVFYLKEFDLEDKFYNKLEPNTTLVKPKFYNFNLKDRMRIFTYSDSLFKMNFNPILKYQTGSFDGESYFKITYGLRFYGYIGDNFGFQFRFYNNREEPNILDKLWNRFTSNQGRDYSLSDGDRAEYSEVNASLNYNWNWGKISVGQDKTNLGYSKNGQIVLSAKPPAFPFIKIEITPTSWLKFNFLHAWLNSDVKDSSSFYSTDRIRNDEAVQRFNWRQKYLAQHTLILTPLKGFDISLGESVIYSDRLEISYLIPIMFFDQADEHISRDNNQAGSNTQFFFALSSRNHIPNTHLWGSFFADELTPDGLFDPKTQYYKFGFTLGATFVNLPIDNLFARAEYTKIYPGTYQHFIPTLTYSSSENFLGHWLGDNADLVFLSLDYTIVRGLNINLWGQFIRKGQSSVGDISYDLPMEPFLYGLRENYDYFGIKLNYEFMHDVFLNFEYQTIKESIENQDLTFTNRNISSYFLLLGYGF